MVYALKQVGKLMDIELATDVKDYGPERCLIHPCVSRLREEGHMEA